MWCVMSDNIKVNFIIDDNCEEPEITIRAKEKSERVDRIVEAVRDASKTDLTVIPAYSDGKLELIPQNDIMRIRTEGRQIVLDTEDRYYIVKQTLTRIEEELYSSRFVRISQSEIINIYKVKRFDVSVSGTIGIEFDNGVKTYASRRYINSIKNFLKSREGE